MFWITKAALAHLKPGSAISNTASVQAYDPSEDLVDDAATKATIANFSKSLAKQGIRVNAVAPGPFWTPLQVCGGQTMENLDNSARIHAGAPGAAGGDRVGLCASGLGGGELYHRSSLRRGRRAR